jgi:excisionase family DNA binding protein
MVGKRSQNPYAQVGDDELLRLYLTLSPTERDQRFVDTARAAQIVGLSRRTIQLWVEIGSIRALPIGRKYKVDLNSIKDFLERRIDMFK